MTSFSYSERIKTSAPAKLFKLSINFIWTLFQSKQQETAKINLRIGSLFAGDWRVAGRCIRLLRLLLLGLGSDVDNLDALLTVVLRAAVRELSLGVEIFLQNLAAGSLLKVDQWATVADLLSKSDLLILWKIGKLKCSNLYISRTEETVLAAM